MTALTIPIAVTKDVDRLCQMFGDNMTMAQIARELGTTRNTISGKVDRLRRARHPAMIEADAKRLPRLDRMAQVAEWMAENDGRMCDMARALDLSPCQALHAWQRVVKAMGAQAV